MTNAHSVEYGSVVQVQRRGDDKKHTAFVEAVGNECDLALLRVPALFPPQRSGEAPPLSLPLGPLPSLQDEVEVLGYPAGGDSLSVTKGVVSRIEMQEYAQAGEHLLAMQIDAAINPGVSQWRSCGISFYFTELLTLSSAGLRRRTRAAQLSMKIWKWWALPSKSSTKGA